MANDDVIREFRGVRGGLDKTGGPPKDTGMEERVAKLEAIIPTLATKADLLEVKGDLSREIENTRTQIVEAKSSIIQWVVGTAVGISVAAITIITFVLNNAIPRQAAPPPTTAQPTIIVVPGNSDVQRASQPAKQ